MSAKRLLALVAATFLALTAQHGLSQQPKDKDKVDTPPLPSEAQVMQVKLKRAQAVLEALAKEDYKALEENAAGLANISKATAFLRAYKTEDYELQARLFQRSAQSIANSAKGKNLDGATLGYLDMTRTCVACHNSFRGMKKMD